MCARCAVRGAQIEMQLSTLGAHDGPEVMEALREIESELAAGGFAKLSARAPGATVHSTVYTAHST